jgi:hypothetical protein
MVYENRRLHDPWAAYYRQPNGENTYTTSSAATHDFERVLLTPYGEDVRPHSCRKLLVRIRLIYPYQLPDRPGHRWRHVAELGQLPNSHIKRGKVRDSPALKCLYLQWIHQNLMYAYALVL